MVNYASIIEYLKPELVQEPLAEFQTQTPKSMIIMKILRRATEKKLAWGANSQRNCCDSVDGRIFGKSTPIVHAAVGDTRREDAELTAERWLDEPLAERRENCLSKKHIETQMSIPGVVREIHDRRSFLDNVTRIIKRMMGVLCVRNCPASGRRKGHAEQAARKCRRRKCKIPGEELRDTSSCRENRMKLSGKSKCSCGIVINAQARC